MPVLPPGAFVVRFAAVNAGPRVIVTYRSLDTGAPRHLEVALLSGKMYERAALLFVISNILFFYHLLILCTYLGMVT